MPKKEILHHLAVALCYTAFVTLLGRHFHLKFSFFWLGGLSGTLLLYFDPLISAYLSSSELPLFLEIKQMFAQKKFKEAVLTAFVHHQEQEQLILHSALFQVALTILSFYIVTSGGSLLGSGLVMGMALHLIKGEIENWRNPEKLNKMLFWNIQREVSPREQKIYLGVIFAFFALETILLI